MLHDCTVSVQWSPKSVARLGVDSLGTAIAPVFGMGFLAKLFGRRPLVVPEPEPVFVREPEPDFEEDWDWQIAYARHRAQPEPAVVPQHVMQAPVVPAAIVRPIQSGTVIPVPA